VAAETLRKENRNNLRLPGLRASVGKWLGKCPECGEWNSLVEEKSQTTREHGRNGFKLREVTAVAYSRNRIAGRRSHFLQA
jgi:predicted ATP-dependent serine protease